MKTFLTLFAVLATAPLSTPSLLAHHGRGASFDMNKQVTLKGTVSRVDWRNPHVVIHMDVKDASGALVTWAAITLKLRPSSAAPSPANHQTPVTERHSQRRSIRLTFENRYFRSTWGLVVGRWLRFSRWGHRRVCRIQGRSVRGDSPGPPRKDVNACSAGSDSCRVLRADSI